jgi:hypothetical protein
MLRKCLIGQVYSRRTEIKMLQHNSQKSAGWTIYTIAVVAVLVGIAALGAYRVFWMK